MIRRVRLVQSNTNSRQLRARSPIRATARMSVRIVVEAADRSFAQYTCGARVCLPLRHRDPPATLPSHQQQFPCIVAVRTDIALRLQYPTKSSTALRQSAYRQNWLSSPSLPASSGDAYAPARQACSLDTGVSAGAVLIAAGECDVDQLPAHLANGTYRFAALADSRPHNDDDR